MWYGIKRFTTLSTITRIGHSFTLLNLRTVWQVFPLWTRKRPNNSRRKWTTEKRMRARAPKERRFKAQDDNQQAWGSRTGKHTIGSEQLVAYCTVRGPPPLHMYRNSNHNRRLSFLPESPLNSVMHRSVQVVIERRRWIRSIHHGEGFWANY